MIIAVCAVIATQMKRNVDLAKSARAVNDCRFYGAQLEAYRARHGSFPTTEQGLRALIGEPWAASDSQSKPILHSIPEIIPDDWGTPYIYRSPGMRHPGGYDLFSAGPDRRADTADDIYPE
jgi:general secretion pathway protein G